MCPHERGLGDFARTPAWMSGAVREKLDADPHPLTGQRTKRDVEIDILMVSLPVTIGVLGV